MPDEDELLARLGRIAKALEARVEQRQAVEQHLRSMMNGVEETACPACGGADPKTCVVCQPPPVPV